MFVIYMYIISFYPNAHKFAQQTIFQPISLNSQASSLYAMERSQSEVEALASLHTNQTGARVNYGL